MRTHRIKCNTESYQQIEIEIKKFTVRENDRNYRRNDQIEFIEEVSVGDMRAATGREQGPFTIDFIFEGGKYGVQKGWVVIQFTRIL